MTSEDRIKDEAIHWAVRTGDPHFEDWDSFTDWLEADALHARYYDQVSAGLFEVTEREFPRLGANDDGAGSGQEYRAGWLAVAASIMLALVFGYTQWFGGSYMVETAPGEVRTLALGDGSSVTLGGGSALLLDRGDARVATLERGRALFLVHHNAADPFVVHAGGHRLVDAGTVFDVSRRLSSITVAVSHGAVVVNPGRYAERLDPGERLTVQDGTRAYRLGSIDIARVGEWAEGRVTFEGATMAEVAAELSRSTGLDFGVTPEIAQRKVSGSVMLAPVAENPGALDELFGVKVRREGESWIMDRP